MSLNTDALEILGEGLKTVGNAMTAISDKIRGEEAQADQKFRESLAELERLDRAMQRNPDLFLQVPLKPGVFELRRPVEFPSDGTPQVAPSAETPSAPPAVAASPTSHQSGHASPDSSGAAPHELRQESSRVESEGSDIVNRETPHSLAEEIEELSRRPELFPETVRLLQAAARAARLAAAHDHRPGGWTKISTPPKTSAAWQESGFDDPSQPAPPSQP